VGVPRKVLARRENLSDMNVQRQKEWTEAAQRCGLSAKEIAMAKELGIGPPSLIKNIPNRSQPWKAPVRDWVRELYEKKFPGRTPRETATTSPVRNADATSKPAGAPTDGLPAEAPGEPASEATDAPPRNLFREAEEEFERAFMDGEIDPETASDRERQIENETPTSDGEIADENERMVRRRDSFRRAAELVAAEMALLPEVEKVVLFGSVAAPLRKEVPRFRRLRRAHEQIWHECSDVDLAVWLSDLTRLKALKKAVSNGVNQHQHDATINNWCGVPHHQIDAFVLESGSDRYRGRLCFYGQCPKGKPECEVPGCGAQPFLRQHEDFHFNRADLRQEWVVTLFERPVPSPADGDVPF
jgi:hypothetical protein